MEKIYKVTTEGDCEGRTTTTLGFCKGNPSDIQTYFEDRKTYHISLSEIEVLEITPDSAKERKVLIDKKKELEEELENINKRIK
jgi:hypothetical protein